jgi:hypothetical protein
LKTFDLDKRTTFNLYDSIHDMEELWDSLPFKSCFLRSDYLKTLEAYRPVNMNFRYALVIREESIIAGFYFQLIPFNAADRLQLENVPKDNLFSCFYRHLKKLVAKRVDFVTLICGNLLATGPYGFIKSNSITSEELQGVFSQLIRTLFQKPSLIAHASVCLVKELPITERFSTNGNSDLNYFHPFLVQPSMILHVSKTWTELKDYLEDLQSKYRLRIRKAIVAAKDLRHIELGLEELKMYQKEIHSLYLNTADGSDFNLIRLHESYFLQLKESLGNRYRLFAFFKDDTIIAFYSFIDDQTELMGHFLGTMKENNLKYQVYMNILIKYIEHGIKGHFKTINLARTALEIKSSVGAVPVEMICYLTHRNKMYNA